MRSWRAAFRNTGEKAFPKQAAGADGRGSVYRRCYTGYWDMQDVRRRDIAHRGISGPGATLWGANARSTDVINIITRKAADTGRVRRGRGRATSSEASVCASAQGRRQRRRGVGPTGSPRPTPRPQRAARRTTPGTVPTVVPTDGRGLGRQRCELGGAGDWRVRTRPAERQRKSLRGRPDGALATAWRDGSPSMSRHTGRSTAARRAAGGQSVLNASTAGAGRAAWGATDIVFGGA